MTLIKSFSWVNAVLLLGGCISCILLMVIMFETKECSALLKVTIPFMLAILVIVIFAFLNLK